MYFRDLGCRTALWDGNAWVLPSPMVESKIVGMARIERRKHKGTYPSVVAEGGSQVSNFELSFNEVHRYHIAKPLMKDVFSFGWNWDLKRVLLFLISFYGCPPIGSTFRFKMRIKGFLCDDKTLCPCRAEHAISKMRPDQWHCWVWPLEVQGFMDVSSLKLALRLETCWKASCCKTKDTLLQSILLHSYWRSVVGRPINQSMQDHLLAHRHEKVREVATSTLEPTAVSCHPLVSGLAKSWREGAWANLKGQESTQFEYAWIACRVQWIPTHPN